MRIHKTKLIPYIAQLSNGQKRETWQLCFESAEGQQGWGEIAPLTPWSRETLEEAKQQWWKNENSILSKSWNIESWSQELSKYSLMPSLSFAVESALLDLLAPLPNGPLYSSALLMGKPEEILAQAKLREKEGFSYAKLKVNNLTFGEAEQMIHALKKRFRLRIDVNRAWQTAPSLRFFEQFHPEDFDYIEEPFADPLELMHFYLPLAVDESFPNPLSLKDLALLHSLKALIYKPTIQGGQLSCKPLMEWTQERGIQLVLSSCFEGPIGLRQIACMAQRLKLNTVPGLGTLHHMKTLF